MIDGERSEVVVIGGGIAGLAAAWRLRDRDVLLLEAGDRLGGRVRSDPRGDYWMNYGAHLFPGPGTYVDALVRDCGLETVPVTGGMTGLAVGSTVLQGGRVESYPLRLPLSARERLAFARAGLRIRRAVAEHRRLRSAAPPADTLAFEDGRTFGEFLGPLPPAVEAILACAAHRATAELSELSAGCGIGLFALVWGGARSLIARNLLGGAGRLPAALGAALGPRARTGCEVTALEPAGDELIVRCGTRAVRARHAIVAVPAPLAAPLVAPVAGRAASALAELTYGPFVSVAVETREHTAMPWDGVYAMATSGRAFDMFTNQAHALRDCGGRRPGGSLMLFAGGHAAGALLGEPDEAITQRFLADLHGLFPQSRGVIADATVQRWERGNVYARPGRHRLQAALEGPLGAHGNVHLAGDYFAELGTMETAARTGATAAERVAARLPIAPRFSDHEVRHVC